MVRRTGPTAFPPSYEGEDELQNEARYRAEVEKAFGILNLNDEELDRRLLVVEDFGGGGGNLFYTVTDNAGGGLNVWDDANATDFTGQDGAVDQCALNPEGAVVYYSHKGQVYFWQGPRPSKVGTCPDSYTSVEADYTPFGQLVDWNDIENKPSTFPPSPHTHPLSEVPSSLTGTYWRLNDTWTVASFSGLPGKPDTYPPSPHTHLEVDITDLDRIRWRGTFVDGNTYEKNDQVLDNGTGTTWTMLANKQTMDRAAPQADGNETYTAPDVPGYTTLSQSAVVESGMEYSNPTAPFILVGVQIWVPAVTPDYNTVIRAYSYSEPDQSDITYQEISEPLLVENDWTTVALNRSIILQGTTFGILINTLNSGTDTTVGPYDWVRAANNNNGDPATGQWLRNNNGGIVRIHKVDDNGVNRGTDGDGSLDGIIPGSNISIVNQTDATQSSSYTVNGAPTYDGTVYEFPVELDSNGVGGEPPVGGTSVVTITVPLPSPTEYVELDPNATGFGTGILRFDGVDQPGADTKLYGVRLLIDTVSQSPDWDVVSYVGSGGGSGGSGGGASTFTELSDTPTSYVGHAGKTAVVKQDETGLEFDTGGSAITSGDTLPASPEEGAQHYLTVQPVGMYYYYFDGDSSQWVQQNGTSLPPEYTDLFVQKTGDNMSGPLSVVGTSSGMDFQSDQILNGFAMRSLNGANPDRMWRVDVDTNGMFRMVQRDPADDSWLMTFFSNEPGTMIMTAGNHWMMGDLSATNNASVHISTGADTGNPHLYFRQNTVARGLIYYSDASDTFEMRKYAASDGTTTTAQIKLNDTGVTLPKMAVDLNFNQKNIDNVNRIHFDTGNTSGDYISWTTAQGCYFYENGVRIGRVGTSTSQLTGFDNVYNGTISAGANVYVSSGGWLRRATSSEKYKKDIETFDGAGAIDQLRPVTFKGTTALVEYGDDPDHVYLGFITEEVAEVIPEAIQDDGENYDVRSIVAVLVSEVQDLRRQVKELKDG